MNIKLLENEIFKDIPLEEYYGRYMASNRGRVYSIITNIILTKDYSQKGYGRVKMTGRNGRVRNERVGRLVGFTFIGEPPEGKTQIDHIDRDRKNDEASNLRWATPSENGRNRRTNRAVQQIDITTGKVIATFGTVVEANEAIGRQPSHTGINNCLNGNAKTAGGYKWKAINKEE